MSNANPKKPHQEALADYLEQLLHEDARAEDAPVVSAHEPVPVLHVAASNQALPEATEWSQAMVAYGPVDPPAQAEPVESEPAGMEDQGTDSDSPEVAEQPDPEPEPAEVSCVPVAADDKRHYLFEVANFIVAIPATRVTAESGLDGVPQAPAGLVRQINLADQRTIPIIDLASLMLPPDAACLQRPLPERATTIALLDDDQWGLAGNGPGRLEDLTGQPVCWRRSGGGRAWLAGTLVERRLVVINLDVLAGMLP